MIPCIGCGALVPDVEGPTFRYPDAASPGCWAIYGEVLAEAYEGPWTPAALHLVVDAYAVQHPGRPTPQTIQSVTVHLISLCCVLERGYPAQRATEIMRRIIARYKGTFEWLPPPASRGAVTVLNVANAEAPLDRQRLARDWATSAWQAWTAHHAVIRCWLDRLER